MCTQADFALSLQLQSSLIFIASVSAYSCKALYSLHPINAICKGFFFQIFLFTFSINFEFPAETYRSDCDIELPDLKSGNLYPYWHQNFVA